LPLLPFRPMSVRDRAVVYRETAGTPGPLVLLRDAIAELASRRRLVRYLAQADMKKRGSDTVLGNLWWILDPLLQMVVYVVFVTIIAPRHQEDYPLFIFAAILPWKWYSSVVTDATTSVVRQDKLIRQIAFPKIVLPFAVTTADTVGFIWGLIPLVGIMLLFADRISLMLLWIPVIAVVQYVFSIATAVFLSAANVFFRDLGNVAGHVLRLWWFLSPSLFSLDQLENVGVIKDHHWIGVLAQANPFAILFTAYRNVIYGTSDGGLPVPPDLASLALLLAASFVLCGLAAIFFKRVEPEFAKVL
jgi:ABC-type polysaccharide/polyol phosphate export permease